MAAPVGDGSNPVHGSRVQIQETDLRNVQIPSPKPELGESKAPLDHEQRQPAVMDTLSSMMDSESRARCQADYQLLATSCLSVLPNSIWRERVAMWCYSIADHLGENRAIVSVAMSILDRYSALVVSMNGPMDSKRYEIASMTAMFLAVRISGSGNLSIQDLLSMRSDSKIQSDDIVSLGSKMVKALTWQQRLVTPNQFLARLLELLPESESSRTVRESARYLVELAVMDASLSRCKYSEVALAAAMNALRADAPDLLDEFVRQVDFSSTMDPHSEVVSSLRWKLHRVYSCSYENRRSNVPHLIVDFERDEEEESTRGGFHSSAAIRSISDDNLPAQVSCSKTYSSSSKRSCDVLPCLEEQQQQQPPSLKRARTGHNLVSLSS